MIADFKSDLLNTRKKRNIVKISVLVATLVSLCNIERINDLSRQKPAHTMVVRMSVVVPCYYKHAGLLVDLIRAYEAHTRQPYEMIIALSEADKVDPSIKQMIELGSYKFPVRLLCSDQPHSAGANRNRACSAARGTVIVCQDADDLPHPQRLEIIGHFFKTQPIDHLMHQFAQDDEMIKKVYDPNRVPYTKVLDFNETWHHGLVTNGNVAFARDVFQKVQWSNRILGEDVAFNSSVYDLFKHTIMLDVPLIAYRAQFSSHMNNNA